jgi:hypothetical protein
MSKIMRNDIYIIPFGRGQKELMIENIYNPFGRSIHEVLSGGSLYVLI